MARYSGHRRPAGDRSMAGRKTPGRATDDTWLGIVVEHGSQEKLLGDRAQEHRIAVQESDLEEDATPATGRRTGNTGGLAWTRRGLPCCIIIIAITAAWLATTEGLAATQRLGIMPLVEHGVVLTPGRTISTADNSHVLQTFVLPIPRSDPDELDVSLDFLCRTKRRSKYLSEVDVCFALRRRLIWSRNAIIALKTDRDRQYNTLVNLVPTAEQMDQKRRRRDAPTLAPRPAATRIPIAAHKIPSDFSGTKIKGDDVLLEGDDDWEGIPVLNWFAERDFYLYGYARAKDVKRLRKDHMVLLHNTNDLRTVTARLAGSTKRSLVRLTEGHNAQRLDMLQLVDHIDNNTVAFLNVTEQYGDYIADIMLLQSLEQIIEQRTLAAVLHYTEQLRRLQVMIIEARFMLRHKLSQVLVSPSDIMGAVDKTNQYLRKEMPRFRVAFRHAAYYYDNSRVMLWRESSTLMIAMNVPVRSQQHLFTIYKVLIFPVPVRVFEEDATGMDGARITGLPTEIALSNNREYYVNQPVLDWSVCFGNTPAICPDVPYQERTSGNTCIAGLIQNDKVRIRATCRTEYVVRAIFPSMAVSLGGSDILVMGNDTTGQLMCNNDRPVDVPINRFAIVSLGCGCAFRSKTAWIPYRVGDCTRKELKATVRFIRNELVTGSLLKDAWQEATLEGFRIQVLPHHPIPPLLRRSMLFRSQVLGTEFAVDMEKLEKHLLDNRLDWDDLATAPESSLPDLSGIGSGISSAFGALGGLLNLGNWLPSMGMILAVLAIGAVVVIICIKRNRGKLPALLLGGGIPKAAADSWHADFTLPPMPTRPPDPPANHCATVITILVFICLALIGVIVYLCRRRIRRLRERLPDGLYIQVATPAITEIIHLGHSVAPLDQVYLARSPSPTFVSVTVNHVGCCGHYITPAWGKVLLKSASHANAQDVPLTWPETLNISKALAQALITPSQRQKGMVRILRYSDDIATVVPIGLARMTLDGWRPIGRPIDVDLWMPPTHDGQPMLDHMMQQYDRPVPRIPVHRAKRATAPPPEPPYLQLQCDVAAANVRMPEVMIDRPQSGTPPESPRLPTSTS